jgi:hypothetical protein
MSKRVVLKVSEGEEIFFKKQEQQKIKALREKNEKERSAKYSEAHQYHCFRCGTPSLVEVQKGKVVVDVCINKGCGAVHLDPGELEYMLKNKGVISSIASSVTNVFR